jgi:hypothetical protein
MKLVFIHGAPAAGKLTTARALVSRVQGRLFDNHAAIDVARAVFDFGAPGFWELVQNIRLSVLDAAGKVIFHCWSRRLCTSIPMTQRYFGVSRKSSSEMAINCCQSFCSAPPKRLCAALPIPIESRAGKWHPWRARASSCSSIGSLRFLARPASCSTARRETLIRTRTLLFVISG